MAVPKYLCATGLVSKTQACKIACIQHLCSLSSCISPAFLKLPCMRINMLHIYAYTYAYYRVVISDVGAHVPFLSWHAELAGAAAVKLCSSINLSIPVSGYTVPCGQCFPASIHTNITTKGLVTQPQSSKACKTLRAELSTWKALTPNKMWSVSHHNVQHNVSDHLNKQRCS